MVSGWTGASSESERGPAPEHPGSPWPPGWGRGAGVPAGLRPLSAPAEVPRAWARDCILIEKLSGEKLQQTPLIATQKCFLFSLFFSRQVGSEPWLRSCSPAWGRAREMGLLL